MNRLIPTHVAAPHVHLLWLVPHFRHTWFLAIFLFCSAIVLANVVHYVLFRILRRKEEESKTFGWGLHRYLGKPARAIFFLTCLLLLLPANTNTKAITAPPPHRISIPSIRA